MSFSFSEYTNIHVGFAPDPTGEAYSTPPVPLAGFKGTTSQHEGNGGEGGREGQGGEGKRGMGKGVFYPPTTKSFLWGFDVRILIGNMPKES